jgi:hypothetical protein
VRLLSINNDAKPAKLTIKLANAITGGLGNASKMPGRTYGTPAEACQVGSKLRKVAGSVCEGCYAFKGFYAAYAKTIKPAQYRRLESLGHPQWVDAMAVLVGRETWFRWHDSGDVQSVEHLARICEVARRTPNTNHWLPTREYAIVKEYRAGGGVIPPNLVVRLSAHKVDGPAPSGFGLPTSTVTTGASEGCDCGDCGRLPTSTVTTGASEGWQCPARTQNNECGECRACWTPEVANVAYPVH